MNIKILAITFLGTTLLTTTSQASMLDQVVYNVVGQASNAAGARLGDEIYYGSSRGTRQRKVRHKVRHRTKRKHIRSMPIAPRMTDEIHIQKALTSLGFYKGKIDGEVNSFETRSAIKSLNIAYNVSNNASLTPQVKDTLIFLGTLFEFDRNLIASSNDNRTKGKKIQTALKIHGYYHDRIDGSIGSGTRACITNYKREKTGSASTALDFEEEYALISSAKEMNDKNIEESIASLKPQKTITTQPQQVNTSSQENSIQQVSVKQKPELKAYQPENNVNYTKPQQPNTVQAQKAVQPQVGNQVQIKQ